MTLMCNVCRLSDKSYINIAISQCVQMWHAVTGSQLFIVSDVIINGQ